MSKLTTHSVHGDVKWPCVWSRTERLALARAVLADEFPVLGDYAHGIGHPGHSCDIDMQAIAYVLIRELADDKNISPSDCARLHRAAAHLRQFEP